MVHPEGVSHKGTKPDCADRGTELNGPIKTGGIGCPAAVAAILIALRVTDIAFGGEQALAIPERCNGR
jgi:hypothetical protein